MVINYTAVFNFYTTKRSICVCVHASIWSCRNFRETGRLAPSTLCPCPFVSPRNHLCPPGGWLALSVATGNDHCPTFQHGCHSLYWDWLRHNPALPLIPNIWCVHVWLFLFQLSHEHTHSRRRTHCKSCWRLCLACWLCAIITQTLINYSIITDIATVIVWILNK